MQKVLFYLIKQKHLSNKIILFAILVVVFSEIKSKILLLCAVKFILSIQGTTFDAIKISWNFFSPNVLPEVRRKFENFDSHFRSHKDGQKSTVTRYSAIPQP